MLECIRAYPIKNNCKLQICARMWLQHADDAGIVAAGAAAAPASDGASGVAVLARTARRSCGRRVEFDGTPDDLQRMTAFAAKGQVRRPTPKAAAEIPVPHGKGNVYAPDAPISQWRYTTIPLPLPGFPPKSKGRVWRGGILGKGKKARSRGCGRGHDRAHDDSAVAEERGRGELRGARREHSLERRRNLGGHAP